MKIIAYLLISILSAMAGVAEAKLVTKTVEYRQGSTLLEGYLAYDDAVSGQRPGVLVVHEWTGLGKYARNRAAQLAGLGYVAFAADIYGKGVRPNTPAEAGKEAGKYRSDRKLLRTRAIAGLEELLKVPLVDPAKVAAIGYCFGGTTVLELARSGAKLNGVVSFHGGLSTDNLSDGKNIRAKVLVLHGADDPHVPPQEVSAFQEEMRNGGVDWQMVFYGGAVHSFTNPDSGNDPAKGNAYNDKADYRSWSAMKSFFAEIFAQKR
ncbi:MAG: dienelactone hydrolase family protein [Geobacteraceae bacterium]